MKEAIQHLIEIVYDPQKRKLRARSIQDGRWVRFPNKLRIDKTIYRASKMSRDARDFWIAGGTIEKFPISAEKNLELETMLELKNKGLLKQFYEVLFDAKNGKANTEMLNILFLVKKIFPTIDEQLLQPLVKTYSHSAFISSDLLLPLQNLLSAYNERRVVNLFANYQTDDFLEDTVIMYERLFAADVEINQILPEKPKNVRELHTLFSRECSKIRTPKKGLNQVLPTFENKTLGEYEVFIPQTSHDLISIGNELSICVGNGHYAEKVLRKQSSIVALRKKGKFSYCIEFHRGHILQGRGFANQDMPTELKKAFLVLGQENSEPKTLTKAS